jgi:deoxyribose-phosphate aldolase
MNSFDVALARIIDHTILSPGCVLSDVQRACGEAGRYGFASVVVPPCYVPFAVAEMKGTEIPVCSVVSFPFGWESAEAKREQSERLLEMGAQEIDMVMNIGEFLSGHKDVVAEEITAVSEICRGNAILKLIIETAYLHVEQIAEVARLGTDSGANMIKTSTGFAPRGATVEDIRVIKRAVGDRAGIKASGGIRTAEQAYALVEAGATRLGCSASVDLISLEKGR